MNKILLYSRLVKFEHTIFAMPFALIGFFMATLVTDQVHFWRLLGTVVLSMVFARNAAMGFNRYLDRQFDAANPRTAKREIPAGLVSAPKALAFVIVNALLFVAVTYLINPLCFALSPVALFIILGYSFTKRITPLCHFVLSFGLSLAPIGAWLAVTGSFAVAPLLFSGVVFFWVSGFDVIYACQDVEFDRQYRLQSIPVLTGIKNALRISVLLHVATFLLVIAAGLVMEANFIYWIGAGIFGVLMVYQHLIVKADDLSRVNLAFGTMNGIAGVVFAVFVIGSLYY
ncbi:MAG: putative 4-hydroxybenzoate polyprenyltransferase [Prolixibacteraceae bacterium]|nr:putative 4-hydroxybenzoate polyprenyltransferase [Prolixibacteraceae bacterium]